MDITIPYYEDNTRISNSNIGWFIKNGPLYLKRMLDGLEDSLKLPQLEKGSMIHEYILQPDEFWNHYVVLDFEIPKVKQQKDFLEEYNKLVKINPLESQDKLKLEAYRSAYSNKKPDNKCIEEAEGLIMCYMDYLEYLDKKDDKKIISFADLNLLKTIKNNIQKHKKANELLFDFPISYEVHNEFHINWEYPKASEFGDLPCKSLLDRLMIDHTNKEIILIDLKTTNEIYNFITSVDKYDYNRQLAYYWLAIHWYFKHELEIDIDGYSFKSYIIAIENSGNCEIRVFEIDPVNIEARLPIIDKIIKLIAWHKDNNLWEHTKEYYDNDGVEKL